MILYLVVQKDQTNQNQNHLNKQQPAEGDRRSSEGRVDLGINQWR